MAFFSDEATVSTKDVTVKKEECPDVYWEPIAVRQEGGNYKYFCPAKACTHPLLGSKNGMRAHINRAHLGIKLSCEYCSFENANPDILAAHVRKQH